jgi:c-di-GMP-binding flagellar brake protein YcgR
MSEPAPRFDIELPVEMGEPSNGVAFRGVSLNISESGMLVRTEQELPRGTTLRFEFAPFGGTAMVIWARQVPRDGRGSEPSVLLGLKFLAMNRQDKKTLARILQAPQSLSKA